MLREWTTEMKTLGGKCVTRILEKLWVIKTATDSQIPLLFVILRLKIPHMDEPDLVICFCDYWKVGPHRWKKAANPVRSIKNSMKIL